MGFHYFDRRRQVGEHPIGRQRRESVERRDLSGVDALVLHQTAFTRGNHIDRYDGVAAHFVVLPNGKVLQLHDLEVRLDSSNGLNSRGIAVEFVGNFPNDHNHWWRPTKTRSGRILRPHERNVTFGAHLPTREQVRGGLRLVQYLQHEGIIRYVLAHRQANSNIKRNCPGPHIWYNVGERAKLLLGLGDGGPGYSVSTHTRQGSPIPDTWRDPVNSVSDDQPVRQSNQVGGLFIDVPRRCVLGSEDGETTTPDALTIEREHCTLHARGTMASIRPLGIDAHE